MFDINDSIPEGYEVCGYGYINKGEMYFEDGKVGTWVLEHESEHNYIKVRKHNKGYKAILGEKYFYVDGVRVAYTNYDNMDFDKDCYKMGNMFKTQEQAEVALKLRNDLFYELHSV